MKYTLKQHFTFVINSHVETMNIHEDAKTSIVKDLLKSVKKYNEGLETKRIKALEWFKELSFEDKFQKTIQANKVITGDKTRHPNSLTGREIELIYNYHTS